MILKFWLSFIHIIIVRPMFNQSTKFKFKELDFLCKRSCKFKKFIFSWFNESISFKRNHVKCKPCPNDPLCVSCVLCHLLCYVSIRLCIIVYGTTVIVRSCIVIVNGNRYFMHASRSVVLYNFSPLWSPWETSNINT